MSQSAKKTALLLLLLATTVCVGVAIADSSPAKWIGSAGLLLDVAGLVQLELSGLFNGVAADDRRPTVGDAARPLGAWVQDKLFFDRRTGFWFIVLGLAEQLAGLWL
jgi:hypothetical protein